MDVIAWLLEGDPSIRYQVQRDLLDTPEPVLKQYRAALMASGHVRRYLDLVDPATGMWGGGVYSPKYVSTHYTLLDLTCLGVDPNHPAYQKGIAILLERMWPSHDPEHWTGHQDMCVAAMVLRMNAYGFNQSIKLNEIVDYVLAHQFPDGGWNCSWRHKPAPHSSSLHTTLSVLEAIQAYTANGYSYRLDELLAQAGHAIDFILRKRLFRSERTGEIIKDAFLRWTFPEGWKYNVIRALDCFRALNVPYDERMAEAIGYLLRRADADGRLKALAPQEGPRHFILEPSGKHSRYNTLRLARIMRCYGNEYRHTQPMETKRSDI